MAYTVGFRPSALKALAALEKRDQRRIGAAIEFLTINPKPANAKKLVGELDLWRIRVGSYRVIYKIEDAKLLILVVKIGHRKDVYR